MTMSPYEYGTTGSLVPINLSKILLGIDADLLLKMTVILNAR